MLAPAFALRQSFNIIVIAVNQRYVDVGIDWLMTGCAEQDAFILRLVERTVVVRQRAKNARGRALI
ncbi:hypothetical protein D3C78_1527270 [compost metagenome]